ncbi:iron-hydroxamate ABC transporter substrate-binding protein [Paenibacillus baekrokdamisoli]|uniref:Iron-hydroxamate ABC transporter substrate-binding protein n=1 Tax=Paenibacillus baekrokdamisoli TaxID=1712516 RepID=A0A3G9IY07_9BACL|nr:iron-hydroxamate ABC transporter substrate-binding protein [Paenibacillus baekrokdamisoli]MBB3068966.1 iron complex transport system substrate-binding protein [Paenibacillus baekrokdamisoli]BBH23787.1 iron-hydroxamate ABC transporter substrate-binding protein [Paenibacillus baekrokdamisoli]
MKKLIFLMSIVCTLILSACSQSAPQQNGAANKDETVSKGTKIASLSIHLTNDLLALGITPVGSVVGGDSKAFLPHVADRLKNTKELGAATDPDMEALLALHPDVIYADEKYAGKDLSKYEKIAKTEVFDLDKGTWRDHLNQVGKLVNREQQAKQFINDYEAQTERVKTLVHKKIGDGKTMAIRVTAKELRVFGMVRPLGPILFDDLGLKPANGVEKINKAYEVISQEVLPDFDADAIFVVVNDEDGAKKVYQQLQKNPIWLGLKAVKENHIYTIGVQPWLDYSALGNKLALDDAEKIFAK